MRVFVRILVILTAVLLAYLIYSFAGHRRTQGTILAPNADQDSIEVISERADSLQQRADALRERMGQKGLSNRPEVKARLEMLDREITNLRQAIQLWRTRNVDDQTPGAVYHECVLLYGKASGTCDALALDTLQPGTTSSPQR